MRAAATILVVVGAGVVAAEVVRRERTAAGQREPFIGIGDLARRLDARRGRFRGAVTSAVDLRRFRGATSGLDLRQPFDDSFFGSFGGVPPVVGAGTLLIDTDVPVETRFFDNSGGFDGSPSPTFGIPNTAPQDMTIAQFAAARRSGESPAVRAVTRAFGGNLPGVIAAIIDTIIDAIAGRRVSAPPAPGLPSAGGALVTGLRIVLGRITGIPGGGIPGPVAGGIPGAIVGLSLALGKMGVDIAARARAATDPTFEGKVELELTRMRQDPQRFFDVLADPTDPRFRDAPPEIRFAPPPSEATAPPGDQGETSLGLSPAPQGETSLGLSPAPAAPVGVVSVDLGLVDAEGNPVGPVSFTTAQPGEIAFGIDVTTSNVPEGVTATVSADPSAAGPQSSPPSADPTEGQTGGTVGESGGPDGGPAGGVGPGGGDW